MYIEKFAILSTAVLLGFSNLAVAEEITREEAAQLMEECQRQRQERIEPEREQAIEDCVSSGRRDRAGCERYYRTYGNPRFHANGTRIPGLYWDLPVCQRADEADRFFKANPGRRVYKFS